MTSTHNTSIKYSDIFAKIELPKMREKLSLIRRAAFGVPSDSEAEAGAGGFAAVYGVLSFYGAVLKQQEGVSGSGKRQTDKRRSGRLQIASVIQQYSLKPPDDAGDQKG